MVEKNTRQMMSDAKFFEGYSRWSDENNRYETWDEAVSRVMNMHRDFYKNKMTPKLEQYINEAENLYKLKYVVGAQRALQFGGPQLIKHQARLFNCTSSYVDRAEFFGEAFYLALAGCGVGFSVQKHHVAKLAKIQNRTKSTKIYVVEDSIEGWASSLDVLLSSFFVGGGKHPEYEGRRVYFDLSLIRQKGTKISGGFKAPGPEPLRKALDKIEYILQGLVLSNKNTITPIVAYDIIMHAFDSVISGGVRRSASIALISPDDDDMINAKTGNWFEENPQRGRSNNSVILVRDAVDRVQFNKIMKAVKEYGEPGFIFTDSTEFAYNPCVEIGMIPSFEGLSGFQGCNLTEINGSKMKNKEEFFKACRAGSILGTLQAGYTNFKFLSETSKKIFDKEALLGVSITGWMNNPDVLFDKENLKQGAEIVKEINKEVAELIGINQAARTTCTKPSGNTSVLLGTSSGIHPEHSKKYIRNVQMNKDTEVAQLIRKENPYMVEDSVWSSNRTDYVISFPVITDPSSLYRDSLYGTNLLEKVKFAQEYWVENGTNVELCTDPRVRHNISNTISVLPEQWDEVENYLFDNRSFFAGVSLIGNSGDKDYHQAPNTEVLDSAEIVAKYGEGALFASGLIVDTSEGFTSLWEATFAAQNGNQNCDQETIDNRQDWIRRFNKFTENYFEGDTKKAEYCLKDVSLLHKWTKIQQNYKPVDFASQLTVKKFIDIDTTGASACVGNGPGCEI